MRVFPVTTNGKGYAVQSNNFIKTVLFEAFSNDKTVKVTRVCFGEKEVCIGEIHEISKREHPKTKETEICFSVVANDKWWKTETLQSLSPWISQVSEIEIL